MPKSQKWTDEEVAELLDLVEEKGQAAALKEFSAKCGRSTDAIRRKLNHIRKVFVDVDQSSVPVEPEVIVESDGNVIVTGRPFFPGMSMHMPDVELLSESECSEMPEEDDEPDDRSLFRRIVDWLLGRK